MFPKLALIIAAFSASTVAAQQAIRWSLQVEQGINYAKSHNKPLMFYVKGSSGGDDDIEDYERDHKHAFADREVAQLARKFVTLQLSRSRYRDQLEAWNLSPRTNLDIVFAKPSGEKLNEPVAASAVADPATLASAMRRALEAWGAELYRTAVQPVLDDPEATVRQQTDALQLVIEYRMREAETPIGKLLDREPPARIEILALEALAAIASDEAITLLFDRAVAGDRNAAKALGAAPPEAAKKLLTYLGGEDMPQHIAAYNAITKICKISGAKPDRFWSAPNEAAKQKEIERVRTAAEQRIERAGAGGP